MSSFLGLSTRLFATGCALRMRGTYVIRVYAANESTLGNIVNFQMLSDILHIFTVKITTNSACGQCWYLCNARGYLRQCYTSLHGLHLSI